MRIILSKKQKAAIILPLAALLVIIACRPTDKLPAKSSPEYIELVRTFYIGLAALQVGDDVRLTASSRSSQGWPQVNRRVGPIGVLALRQRNFDTAAVRLERARALAPNNDQILPHWALTEWQRAVRRSYWGLRKAVDLNPQNFKAIYLLAEEVERQADSNSEAEYQQLMQKILAVDLNNLAAMLELEPGVGPNVVTTRPCAIQSLVSTRDPLLGRQEVQEQLSAVQAAVAGTDPRAAATRIAFLRNVWCAFLNIARVFL